MILFYIKKNNNTIKISSQSITNICGEKCRLSRFLKLSIEQALITRSGKLFHTSMLLNAKKFDLGWLIARGLTLVIDVLVEKNSNA